MNEYTPTTERVRSEYAPDDLTNALNAIHEVLDMHKPETPKKWVPVRCNHCRTPYPCPTVEMIQDAIGEEQA